MLSSGMPLFLSAAAIVQFELASFKIDVVMGKRESLLTRHKHSLCLLVQGGYEATGYGATDTTSAVSTKLFPQHSSITLSF